MEFKKIPKDESFNIKKLGTQKNINDSVIPETIEVVEAIKEKIEIYQCVVDVVVSVDVSSSVGYNYFPNYLASIGAVGPGNSGGPYGWTTPLALAQNDLVSSLITQFTPYMNNGDLQMGICSWSTSAMHMTHSNGPSHGTYTFTYSGNPVTLPNVVGMQQTASGKWLSNDPVELDIVAQSITGEGGNAHSTALNLNHEHLNKAQTDPGNCSLGDRLGQPGFSRVIIFITDTRTPMSLTDVQTAEGLWKRESIYAIRTSGNSSPLSMADINAFKTALRPISGNDTTTTSPQTSPPFSGGELNNTFAGSIPQLPGIANDIWEKVCPPESYNCINFTCIDPGDGSGTYSAANGHANPLTACQAVCGATTYDCDSMYNCIPVPFGGTPGTYATLALCQDHCVPPSYNCDLNTGCYQAPIPGPPGTYSSLQNCIDDCQNSIWSCMLLPPTSSTPYPHMGCSNSVWYAGTTPTGPHIYSTLQLCEDNCIDASWNCTPTGCIDPGDGSGLYLIPGVCEDECKVWECTDVFVNIGQLGGSATGPSGNQCLPRWGGQAAVTAGNNAGGNWFLHKWDCEDNCQEPTWDCVATYPLPGIPTHNCVLRMDGSGQYNSLQSCHSRCGPNPPVDSWDCNYTTGQCTYNANGLGAFPTLAACQQGCG
tara:strand:+ start:2282 stop:4237 length:1956 start_codon:yes stop_codon:yes gene_type:complete